MDYFVNTENSTYNNWQLELLIESFKYQKCDDSLLVSFSGSNLPINKLFWYNIPNHKRILYHDNFGAIRGYVPLNNLYAMEWSIQNNWLKQPFAYIPIDV